MASFEMPEFRKPEGEKKKETRESIMASIERGESLAGKNLVDLDLTDMPLADQDFTGCDARGLILDQGDPEVRTNISRSKFVDTIFADSGNGTNFINVEAEGAFFGYTETLQSRRNRHAEAGRKPDEIDCGMLNGFDGQYGNFPGTVWANIDFGGGTDHPALFWQADFLGAIFDGCDLSGIDLSESRIDDIEIKNPVSVKGLIINEEQVDSLAKALKLNNREDLERNGIKIIAKQA